MLQSSPDAVTLYGNVCVALSRSKRDSVTGSRTSGAYRSFPEATSVHSTKPNKRWSIFAPLSWMAVTAADCTFCSRASSSSGVSSVCRLSLTCCLASESASAGRSYDGLIPSSVARSLICASRRARAFLAASRRSRSLCDCNAGSSLSGASVPGSNVSVTSGRPNARRGRPRMGDGAFSASRGANLKPPFVSRLSRTSAGTSSTMRRELALGCE